jgi:hypothetical protein
MTKEETVEQIATEAISALGTTELSVLFMAVADKAYEAGYKAETDLNHG